MATHEDLTQLVLVLLVVVVYDGKRKSVSQ